ncbi:MAG: type II toxin-antitoxin system ParD family antitoxin [Candidatus Eremiobacteraeota bacterium]|nr:type II toxin-antitoxin system ParD family antitoxin [Candidatus Eremiobacteraeota bacterium]
MATKNVSLPRELEQYIDAKVAAGEYSHASEVVRDGVRLLMERDAEKLRWLREAVAVGLAELDHGEFVPAEEVTAEKIAARGMARLKAMKAAGKA